jgi:hypothetical protein
MYLNQFRVVKCFIEKTPMMEKVIGVPQNMECVFRAPSVRKLRTIALTPCEITTQITST